MPAPVIGQTVEAPEAPMTSGKNFRLADFHDKAHVVLYFYPKDNTPGCTTEGQDFRDAWADFQAAGAAVFGISRDSLKMHENFRTRQDFPFELIADTEENLCRYFEVIKLKNLYGRQVLGIERSTFLIDKNGVLRQEWRKVKVKAHVAQVLQAVQAL
ncbi:MAG: peroxiredoxin [Thiothrix sp.]|nr:peroxiredoxin [Thiothrix sp.]HPQ96871.1 peroxiredoxin [Thiolinea sp.]